jgi:drug/metabolite transporter (DMT)-like permease
VLGLMFITITQGAQYVALDNMPAATVSLLLNFSAIIVAVLGIILLAERPTALQWIGSVLFLGGVLIYFYPVNIPGGQVAGLIATAVGVIANAGSSVLGRQINREGHVDPFLVTFVTIGIGAAVLLIVGFATGRAPTLTLVNWLIILWLAAVNTAFAFLLWNQTLRVLSAVESSMINNAMMIQIPIMAWIFLGESLTAQEIFGMVVAAVGMILVQLRRGKSDLVATPEEPIVTAELMPE